MGERGEAGPAAGRPGGAGGGGRSDVGGGLRWARWHWWRGAAARMRDGVAAAVVTRTERLAMDAAELGRLAGRGAGRGWRPDGGGLAVARRRGRGCAAARTRDGAVAGAMKWVGARGGGDDGGAAVGTMMGGGGGRVDAGGGAGGREGEGVWPLLEGALAEGGCGRVGAETMRSRGRGRRGVGEAVGASGGGGARRQARAEGGGGERGDLGRREGGGGCGLGDLHAPCASCGRRLPQDALCSAGFWLCARPC